MRRQILTCSTAILAALCVVPLHSAAGQDGTNRAEFVKAVQCASLFGFVSGQVPAGSPAYEELSKRRTAWLGYATKANGGNSGMAQQAAIEATIALRGQLNALGSDEDKITAKLQPLNAQCEAPPPASVPAASNSPARTPAAPKAKPPTEITERDRNSGELAIRCAGIARFSADIDNFIALELYGEEEVYQKIITHFRPDLSPQERESGILKAKAEHAQVIAKDTEASRASIMAGNGSLKPDDTVSVQRSQECARMVNVLRRVKVID